MLKGVVSRRDVILDDGRTDGFEHVRRGPLTIVFGQAPGAVCVEVDEITCVLNGYLYDCADLARRVGIEEGNAAELIARGYRRSGEQILSTLRGRYSLALWDNRSQRGLLACDLLAMEALYYWRGAGRLAFASELKDLFSLLPATPGPDPIAFHKLADGWIACRRRDAVRGREPTRPRSAHRAET